MGPMDDLAPKQDRSRRTLEALLKAAICVLDEHGLEHATIPRISKAAKVSAASVYRRFEDKDALIHAALLHVLETSSKAVRELMRSERFADSTIEAVAKRLVAGMFRQYREHPRLLQALKRFAESHEDFDAKATALFAQNFRWMVDAVCACKGLDGVHNKRAKIRLALMTVATAIEIKILEPTSLWNVVLKDSDTQLQQQLVTMFLTYLGVKD